jgi:hypothetical protein
MPSAKLYVIAQGKTEELIKVLTEKRSWWETKAPDANAYIAENTREIDTFKYGADILSVLLEYLLEELNTDLFDTKYRYEALQLAEKQSGVWLFFDREDRRRIGAAMKSIAPDEKEMYFFKALHKLQYHEDDGKKMMDGFYWLTEIMRFDGAETILVRLN